MEKKNNAKVMIDFQINITEIKNGSTTVNNHMDGKFTMEINEVREITRAAVASALKGVADSLENEEGLEDEEDYNSPLGMD